MKRAAEIAIAVAAISTPALARANGDTAHAWISTRAVELLPEGSLKDLLSDPTLRPALISGSVFPDGGYIVGDDYGEMAHWEPFLQAYIEWVGDTYAGTLTTVGSEHVAFLMGIASHGLADQTFDAGFGPAARIHDAAGWSDVLLSDHDSNTDLMIVAQTGARFDEIETWLPAMDLAALYRDRFDYTVSAVDLENNQELLRQLTLGYAPRTNDATRMAAALRYPWSAENLLDPTEPGAPPDQTVVVASYWLAVWDRLHDLRSEQNFVIATHPRDGAAGHPTDHMRVESQAVIDFGHGIETARLLDHVEVHDDTGAVHAVDLASPWNTAVTNLLRIRPRQDWPADRDITVTVAAGVTAIDGLTLTAPFQFTFSTRSAAPSAPSSDPTPHAGDPAPRRPLPDPVPDPDPVDRPDPVDPEPAPRDSGGCATGAGASLAVGLLLLGLRRRRPS